MRVSLRLMLVLGLFALVPAIQAGSKDDKKAAPAAAMEQMKPVPELEELKWLVGSWKIAEKHEAGPMGPGGDGTGSEEVILGPGGFSYITHYQSLSGPMGASFNGRSITTWDNQAKALKMYWIDNMGPGVMEMTGKKEGKNYVYSGEMTMPDGKKCDMRITISDITPTSYTHVMDATMGGPDFKRMMTMKYTKK
jgi:hypothetical protein